MTSSADRLLMDTLLFAMDGHAQPLMAAVARQEAEGQTQMTEGALLPTDIRHGSQADLEAMGVVFGEAEDELFVKVQLPTGWRIEATDHGMHSHLLDAQGRKRAELFYKAAVYDRRADLTLVPRFSINSHAQRCDAEGRPDDNGSYRQVAVCQDGQPLQVMGHYERRDWSTENALRHAGEAWLDNQWPEWRQVTAYWDTPNATPSPGPQSLVEVANHFLDTRDDLLEDDEEIERNMDEATALEVIRREYVSGTCQAFAVVLHDHLNLPIVKVAGGLHMAVQQADGTLVDFIGAFTAAQLDQRYGTRNSVPHPVTREDALAAFVLDADEDTEHDPWSDLNVARWVRQTLDRWTPDMTPAAPTACAGRRRRP